VTAMVTGPNSEGRSATQKGEVEVMIVV
jgi:hypothetical protein